MPLGWKIEYTAPGAAAEDITAKVAGFSITAGLDAFCRELTLDVIDRAFFDGLDFSALPAAPAVEVFTRTDAAWQSQGKFFIERPVFAADPDSDQARGVWGRSETALLAEPFAPRITKAWDRDATLYGICAEVCALAGVGWDESLCDVGNFLIYAGTFEAEKKYPAEILQALAKLAGGRVVCNRHGHVYLKRLDYDPQAAGLTITDAEIGSIREKPVFPAFGNRVRIIPTGSTSGLKIDLVLPDPCISALTPFRKPAYARVTDSDGHPVNGAVVTWSLEYAGGLASGLARVERASVNTGDVTITREQVRAGDYYTFQTRMPADQVLGVYAAADLARQHDFAAAGYATDGRTVTLNSPFTYCDQLVLVDYVTSGVAVDALVPDGDPSGDGQCADLVADIGGERASAAVYINNPCRCPIRLTLKAAPGSIDINETAKILAYAEDAGGPVTAGRQVFLSQAAGVGFLEHKILRLGSIAVDNESALAINEVAGLSQCDVEMFPSSVYGVWVADANGGRSGANLFAGFAGKRITLNAAVTTGTALVVSYYAQGAAWTRFRGGRAGTARILGYMQAHTEAPLQAETSVTVHDAADPYIDGWTPGDWGIDADPPWDALDYYDDYDYEEVENDGTEEEDCEKQCEQARNDCEADCNEQYDPGQELDDCLDDCEAAVDPCKADCEEEKDPGGGGPDPWDETETDGECTNATCEGTTVCCLQNGVLGCRELYECGGSGFGGYAAADCDGICENELARYGTTRAYDGGSMRPLSDIVRDDYGYSPGTQDHQDKVSALETDALADCVENCRQCESAGDLEADGPETLAPGANAVVRVTGGKLPLAVDDNGGANGFTVTGVSNRDISISQSDQGCGASDITVTDACGNQMTIEIRSTAGHWKNIGKVCKVTSPKTYLGWTNGWEAVNGAYKTSQNWKPSYKTSQDPCPGDCPGWCADYVAQNPTYSCEPCLIPDYIPCHLASSGVSSCHAGILTSHHWECDS